MRIALIDLETAPNLSWTWGKWEQDVIDFDRNWYILCFAVKWFGEKGVKTYALPDFPLYKKDRENDKELVKKLWEVFNEADIIVAHNGDKFDIKKSNSRFIVHELKPPSPYKTVDTLRIARQKFAFNSNKLDDLGRELNLGRKIPHTGFHLWRGCMEGKQSAWRVMKKYNSHDVVLLEQVYITLRAWANTHPNLNLLSNKNTCPVCAGRVEKRGFSITKTKVNQRFHCTKCGAWSSSPKEGAVIR